jgi:hypothetical protein
LFDDAVFKGKLAKAVADAVVGDQFVGQLLQAHAAGEIIEGDRCGPDVAQPLQGVESPALALVSEREDHIERAV